MQALVQPVPGGGHSGGHWQRQRQRHDKVFLFPDDGPPRAGESCRRGDLRVSFGHFGDTSLVEDGLTSSRAFTALMNNGSTSPARFADADAGYFVEVFGKEPELRSQLLQLCEETASKGNAALANRFIYGTDWEMTLTEGSTADYLADFVRLFDQLEAGPAIRAEGISGLSKKFFGGNAAAWIGLAAGGAA